MKDRMILSEKSPQPIEVPPSRPAPGISFSWIVLISFSRCSDLVNRFPTLSLFHYLNSNLVHFNREVTVDGLRLHGLGNYDSLTIFHETSNSSQHSSNRKGRGASSVSPSTVNSSRQWSEAILGRWVILVAGYCSIQASLLEARSSLSHKWARPDWLLHHVETEPTNQRSIKLGEEMKSQNSLTSKLTSKAFPSSLFFWGNHTTEIPHKNWWELQTQHRLNLVSKLSPPDKISRSVDHANSNEPSIPFSRYQRVIVVRREKSTSPSSSRHKAIKPPKRPTEGMIDDLQSLPNFLHK